MAAFALVAMPTAGQAPPPPCAAGVKVPPGQVRVHRGPRHVADAVGGGDAPRGALHRRRQREPHVGHRPLDPDRRPARSRADPRAPVRRHDAPEGRLHAGGARPADLHRDVDAAHQPGGPPCTASASATVTATAPTPARASRQLGYSIGHRPGKAGNNNEFTLSARVISDPRHGDRSPIRIAVRAVTGMRRPPPGTPAHQADPRPVEHPPCRVHGRRSRLVRVRAGPYADKPFIYEFKVGVLAYPPHGRGRARRGLEMTLSQGSRTLATFRFVTSCSAADRRPAMHAAAQGGAARLRRLAGRSAWPGHRKAPRERGFSVAVAGVSRILSLDSQSIFAADLDLGGQPANGPAWPCTRWGLPSRHGVAVTLVRSYRTISTLPVAELCRGSAIRAVCFCLATFTGGFPRGVGLPDHLALWCP